MTLTAWLVAFYYTLSIIFCTGANWPIIGKDLGRIVTHGSQVVLASFGNLGLVLWYPNGPVWCDPKHAGPEKRWLYPVIWDCFFMGIFAICQCPKCLILDLSMQKDCEARVSPASESSFINSAIKTTCLKYLTRDSVFERHQWVLRILLRTYRGARPKLAQTCVFAVR